MCIAFIVGFGESKVRKIGSTAWNRPISSLTSIGAADLLVVVIYDGRIEKRIRGAGIWYQKLVEASRDVKMTENRSTYPFVEMQFWFHL